MPGRGTERLHHARDDEAGNACRKDCGKARQRGEREAGEHHRAAAEAVGQRAEQELRGCQPEQIERHRQLRLAGIGRKPRAAIAGRAGTRMLSESDPTPVIATSSTISEVRGSRRASLALLELVPSRAVSLSPEGRGPG
jgi:hypothetical protein